MSKSHPPVIFDPADFRAAYPAYAGKTDVQLQNAFDEAEMFVDNTPTSIIPTTPKNIRKRLLYFAMLHGFELEDRGMGQTGAVASASQGSVSVSFGQAAAGAIDPYWAQTNWGVKFWAAIRPYRLGPLLFNRKAGR